ncbi:hypothetical protein MMF94_40900 [Pseudonocardia alaniniphila]|uniref:Uncharacterized protein n=1 Tax=Pseudonocardia alaniniphila TaxID=75291 RepID=A0ABS9TUJ8_9PSEU|nr:hypothetical protein [Pseudonocardia alaniniphila]MCH6172078.1 hypothetical protein [Pseudonocardia alaniniphila]
MTSRIRHARSTHVLPNASSHSVARATTGGSSPAQDRRSTAVTCSSATRAISMPWNSARTACQADPGANPCLLRATARSAGMDCSSS